MRKSISWELRRLGDINEKIIGGAFGGGFSMETANRLIEAQGWQVEIADSGNPQLLAKAVAVPVSLHFIVDIAATEKGQAALREHRESEMARQAEIGRIESEIADAIENLGVVEALRRLKS